MADPYHKNLEKRLRDLRFKVNDSLDRPNDPNARSIQSGLQKAEDMAESGQNLRSIEDKLKTVQRQLQQDQDLGESERVMDPHHSEQFHQQLEDIRMDMRKQSSY